MTKIKLCGLTRVCDIEAANELKPEYIGFVFAPDSRRYVTPHKAQQLRQMLDPGIRAVGVFVRENAATVAALLNSGMIDIAQLHGDEDEAYIRQLRTLTDKPLIRAFRIRTANDLEEAARYSADHILLDSGQGTGTAFDWQLLRNFSRPCFLAGGLTPDNVGSAVRLLHPYGVDVSSGIETNGLKDKDRMAAFTAVVRKEDDHDKS